MIDEELETIIKTLNYQGIEYVINNEEIKVFNLTVQQEHLLLNLCENLDFEFFKIRNMGNDGKYYGGHYIISRMKVNSV